VANGDLTTLENVKAFAFPGDDTVARDRALTLLIASASKWFADEFRAVVRRPLLRFTTTRTLDGNGKPRISLPHFPVSSVASVKIDGIPVNPSTAITDLGGWVLSNAGIGELALRGQVFRKDLQNVEVTYTAGCYAWTDDLANIPANIQQAVVEWVATDFQRAKRLGVTAENVAGSSTTYGPAGIPANVAAVIESYCKAEF
jgi:hypothetical protein